MPCVRDEPAKRHVGDGQMTAGRDGEADGPVDAGVSGELHRGHLERDATDGDVLRVERGNGCREGRDYCVSTMGACQNAAFCPAGSRTVT
jgi:hypothetical protein